LHIITDAIYRYRLPVNNVSTKKGLQKQIIHYLIYITRGWILVRRGRLWKGLQAPGRLRVRQDHTGHRHRAQVQPLRNLHGPAEEKGKIRNSEFSSLYPDPDTK
jgi:hypothetical protein